MSDVNNCILHICNACINHHTTNIQNEYKNSLDILSTIFDSNIQRMEKIQKLKRQLLVKFNKMHACVFVFMWSVFLWYTQKYTPYNSKELLVGYICSSNGRLDLLLIHIISRALDIKVTSIFLKGIHLCKRRKQRNSTKNGTISQWDKILKLGKSQV